MVLDRDVLAKVTGGFGVFDNVCKLNQGALSTFGSIGPTGNAQLDQANASRAATAASNLAALGCPTVSAAAATH